MQNLTFFHSPKKNMHNFKVKLDRYKFDRLKSINQIVYAFENVHHYRNLQSLQMGKNSMNKMNEN